jgi:hypothetical protein
LPSPTLFVLANRLLMGYLKAEGLATRREPATKGERAAALVNEEMPLLEKRL